MTYRAAKFSIVALATIGVLLILLTALMRR
jgi:hypothetical protein